MARLHPEVLVCASCNWSHQVRRGARDFARKMRAQFDIDWVCSYCEQYGLPRCHPFGQPGGGCKYCQGQTSSLAPCPECSSSGGSYEAFLRGM